MALSVEISGLDELDNQLRQLEKKTSKKILKSTLGMTATKVVKVAKKNAPVRTRKLKKAIFKSTSRVGGVKFVRGPMAAQATIGVKRYGDKGAPHAWVMEYGTRQRYRGQGRYSGVRTPYRSGRRISTGRVRGYQYMEKAWRAAGGQRAIISFKDIMNVKIREAIR